MRLHAAAWALSLPLSLGACAEPPTATNLRGTLEVRIADDFTTGAWQRDVILHAGDGRELELRWPDSAPEPASGDLVEVDADTHELREHGRARAPSCSTVGEQKIAVILVTAPGESFPVDPKLIYRAYFDPERSVDGYLQEASHGLAYATGDVFGPYVLDKQYGCAEKGPVRAKAIELADPDVHFPDYNRVVVVWTAPPAGCPQNGDGTIGCFSLNAPADGPFYASTSWLFTHPMTTHEKTMRFALHELGHNLTLGHARSRDHGDETIMAPGEPATFDEYGGLWSVMGLGHSLSAYGVGHFDAPHKHAIGWLDGGQVVTVESNGTFLISPYEDLGAGSGARALQVRRGPGLNAWYWLELRQNLGEYDADFSAGGLVMHYGQPSNGGTTQLLDLTPASQADDFADSEWPAAPASWTDIYTGLTLDVAPHQEGLLVTVSYGLPTCVRQPPTIQLSPVVRTGLAGQPGSWSFAASVRNHDSSGCYPTSFDLWAQVPGGWQASFSPGSLSLAPGDSGGAIMSLGSPPAPPAGITSNLFARVTRFSVQDTFNPLVGLATPTASHQVALAAAGGALSAHVWDGYLNAAGAEVRFVVIGPDGLKKLDTTVVTGPDGLAAVAYTPAQSGTHTVFASAEWYDRYASSNVVSLLAP